MPIKHRIETPGDPDPELQSVTPTDEAAVDAERTPSAPRLPPGFGIDRSSDLPNADDIDTDAIPFGRVVLSAQGYVCSTQPEPLVRPTRDAI